MGILDDLMKQGGGESGGGLLAMAAKNPQAIAAIVSLLSGRDSSVGGSGGLGGLIDLFQKKGLGDMMSSWISTGPNPPISPAQVVDVLGQDTVKQFATKAGVPHSEAGSLLASLLPAAIDHLTPQGKAPETNALESALSGILSGFGK